MGSGDSVRRIINEETCRHFIAFGYDSVALSCGPDRYDPHDLRLGVKPHDSERGARDILGGVSGGFYWGHSERAVRRTAFSDQ